MSCHFLQTCSSVWGVASFRFETASFWILRKTSPVGAETASFPVCGTMSFGEGEAHPLGDAETSSFRGEGLGASGSNAKMSSFQLNGTASFKGTSSGALFCLPCWSKRRRFDQHGFLVHFLTINSERIHGFCSKTHILQPQNYPLPLKIQKPYLWLGMVHQQFQNLEEENFAFENRLKKTLQKERKRSCFQYFSSNM